MRPVRLERLTRWGTVAMLLFLVHGLGAPRAARAGCNHLVSSRSDRLGQLNQLDALITGVGPIELLNDLARPDGPTRPTPCSGPGCSNRAPMPVPTAVPLAGGTDQWVTLSVRVVLPPASPFDRAIEGPVPGPSRRASFIFHPPRS